MMEHLNYLNGKVTIAKTEVRKDRSSHFTWDKILFQVKHKFHKKSQNLGSCELILYLGFFQM